MHLRPREGDLVKTAPTGYFPFRLSWEENNLNFFFKKREIKKIKHNISRIIVILVSYTNYPK